MAKTNATIRKIIERLAVVETKIDNIADNEIPHIKDSMKGIKSRIRALEMTVWKAAGGIFLLFIIFQLALIWLKGGV